MDSNKQYKRNLLLKVLESEQILRSKNSSSIRDSNVRQTNRRVFFLYEAHTPKIGWKLSRYDWR